MKPNRRRFLAVCAAVALSGTARAATVTRHRFRALGTDAQITLIGTPQQANAAIKDCLTEVAEFESAFSLYDPNSILSRLNRLGSVTGNARFLQLTRHALTMAKTTRGAFDPTVQPLWHALASGGNLKQARDRIGWRNLQIDADTIHFNHPDMAATFNGIAQGFAADEVTAILARYGFGNALVDLGEFAPSGSKPDAPWRLGIRNPKSGRVIHHIEPKAAIATSEPSGTLVADQPHIVDPLERPGQRWLSVTVESKEAWRADALSTAIAASPISDTDTLLGAGGATRSWLIDTAGQLRQWRAKKNC
jgi:thiamine biosynthesis lipoprotein